MAEAGAPVAGPTVPLRVVAREWTRLGCIGFGGPPAHIALLRQMCVQEHGWIAADDFEHAVAATNLLPGPASTQLSIWCAWRVAGRRGGLLGGVCFIVPGLVMIIFLAALFLAGHPPRLVRGIAAGAGSAVPAVAVAAAVGLIPASWKRIKRLRFGRARWLAYVLLACAVTPTIGPWLVLVIVGSGLVEVAAQDRPGGRAAGSTSGFVPVTVSSVLRSFGSRSLASKSAATIGGLGALAWVALKVGALSYGGGFVIIPLMQSDAVNRYHWMSGAQFLNAVALGQVTPGPVVHTVAAVGYAAAGVGGALLAALVAFAPSFVFVLGGARRFDSLRTNDRVRAFLDGAGPAAIGGIAGSAVTLGRSLELPWQVLVLGLAGLGLLILPRRTATLTVLLVAAASGCAVAALGGPLPG